MTDRLIAGLHGHFCVFQNKAKSIQDQLEATQMPLDTGVAEAMLEEYSLAMAGEFRRSRDVLRKAQWGTSRASQEADHDALSICLAVWEVVHEAAISLAPSCASLLRWYNGHYLEEELAEWWQAASKAARVPGAEKADSPFWEPVYRLALSDCRREVLQLLRQVEALDQEGQVAKVVDFLACAPSLQETQAASWAEFHGAIRRRQRVAQRLLEDTPRGHPTRQLLRIYAGCRQADFEDGDDIASELGRTWIEAVVYAHAWVLPDLRRHELGDLLRAVAKRRTEEHIDDIDRVLFAALSSDVPALTRMLESDQARFPPIFVTHLLDVLYYGGRLSITAEPGGEEPMPPRDRHLLRYAKELYRGPRPQRCMAVDYLRAGGAEPVTRELEDVVRGLCASAASDEEMEAAVAMMTKLDLVGKLGAEQCQRKAEDLRSEENIAGCLRWAGLAEHYSLSMRGWYVSDLLDSMAEDDEEFQALMKVLAPQDPLAEPLDIYPPQYLDPIFASHLSQNSLRRSRRLYFFVQYARCRALRQEGRKAEEYVPALVRLLSDGMAGPAVVVKKMLEAELLPALSEEPGLLSAEDAMALMRFVQGLGADPLGRVRLGVPGADVQKTLGDCLSAAIIRGSPLGAPAPALFAPQPLGAQGAWPAQAMSYGVAA